jgi:rhamnosyltransferase
MEIISCDDHSVDGTAEYLATIPQLRRIVPPEGKYIPGKTLNYMISQAKGDIIVFNNSDAIPQNREYLKNLTVPLKNENVDCVFGNQIAREDAYYVVRKDYERAFGDGSISKNWGRFFSLVSSGFRKADLLLKPFNDQIQYSEDSEWVNRNRANIVYVSGAIVEHSHNYTLKEVRKRFFNEGVADIQMGKSPISLLRALRNVIAETLRDYIYLVKHGKFGEVFYPPIYRWVQKISYYRGTKQ